MLTVRRVIQNVPVISARTMYAGHTTQVTQNGASLNTLGTGNATMTNSSAAPMPTRLADRMKTVRITWMRTRLLCRVTLSRTRPSLCATLMVASA